MKAITLIALLFTNLTFAQVGTVKFLRGEAKIQGGKALALGDTVAYGAVIETSAKSLVRLKLEDDIAVQVGPNSTFKLERSPDKSALVLNLSKGEVSSRINPRASESERFRVQTPMAVMGVRGTTFYTSTQKPEATHLCVCEGKVAVTWNKKTKVIETKHHDQPTLLAKEWTPVAVKDFPAHTDEDGQALAEIIANP